MYISVKYHTNITLSVSKQLLGSHKEVLQRHIGCGVGKIPNPDILNWMLLNPVNYYTVMDIINNVVYILLHILVNDNLKCKVRELSCSWVEFFCMIDSIQISSFSGSGNLKVEERAGGLTDLSQVVWWTKKTKGQKSIFHKYQAQE